MNAVRGNQQAALDSRLFAARGAVREGRLDSAGFRLEGSEMVAEVDAVAAKPVAGGIEEDLLEHAPVQGELRPSVAGVDATRLRPIRSPRLVK